jgi:hypothetical protein
VGSKTSPRLAVVKSRPRDGSVPSSTLASCARSRRGSSPAKLRNH